MPNPDFKGPWTPKRITNPNHKGEWKPKQMPNPEYKEDGTVGEYESNYVGLDLWQVKSGIVIVDLLVTDDVEYAKEFSENHFVPNVKPEQEAFKKYEDEKKEKEKKGQEEFMETQAGNDQEAKDDGEKNKDEESDDKDEL